mgnify:CR=1 FL=1
MSQLPVASQEEKDVYFMGEAIALAQRAGAMGEVPIGCVITRNARIPVVVLGASDSKAGSVGSVTDLFTMPYNHHPQVIRGIREEECAALLRGFFRSLRGRKKSRRTAGNIDKPDFSG